MSTEKKPGKADAATVRARIDEVLRIRIDGAAYQDVQQYSAEKGWGGEPGKPLSERQIREYMARADVLLTKRQEKKHRRIIAMHMARREALYARAVNAADYRTGLAVLSDLAKLQGLYPTGGDLKELAKLIAAQATTIRELEGRLNAPGPA